MVHRGRHKWRTAQIREVRERTGDGRLERCAIRSISRSSAMRNRCGSSPTAYLAVSHFGTRPRKPTSAGELHTPRKRGATREALAQLQRLIRLRSTPWGRFNRGDGVARTSSLQSSKRSTGDTSRKPERHDDRDEELRSRGPASASCMSDWEDRQRHTTFCGAPADPLGSMSTRARSRRSVRRNDRPGYRGLRSAGLLDDVIEVSDSKSGSTRASGSLHVAGPSARVALSRSCSR